MERVLQSHDSRVMHRFKTSVKILNRSRIHEHTIFLRFLGIILRISDLRFLYGFLNKEGGMVFYQVFLLSPLQCTVTFTIEMHKTFLDFEEICKMSLKKYKSQGKAVEVTVNSKEKNFQDFCLDFLQEFGLWRC